MLLFKNFSISLSLRQKFIFFAFCFFFTLPPILYYVHHTADYFIKSKKVQLQGIEYQRQIGRLIDIVEHFQAAVKPDAEFKNILDTEFYRTLHSLQELQSATLMLIPQPYGEGFSKGWLPNLPLSDWEKDWKKMEQNGAQTLLAKLKKTLLRSGENLLFFNNVDPHLEDLANAFMHKKAATLPSMGKILDNQIQILSRVNLSLTLLFWLSAFLILLFVVSRCLTSPIKRFAELLKNLTLREKPNEAFYSLDRGEFVQEQVLFDQLVQGHLQKVAKAQEFSRKIEERAALYLLQRRHKEKMLHSQQILYTSLERATQNIGSRSKLVAERMADLEKLHSLSVADISKNSTPAPANDESISHGQIAKEEITLLLKVVDNLNSESIQIVAFMKEVEKRVIVLNQLISFIHTISEKANLLALNAAIETATISRQRKSFVSITQKIQRFASHTSHSTAEIGNIFQEISKQVQRALAETKVCAREIHLGSEKLIPLNDLLQKIAEKDLLLKKERENFKDLFSDQSHQIEKNEEQLNLLKSASTKNQELVQAFEGALDTLNRKLEEIKYSLKNSQKPHKKIAAKQSFLQIFLGFLPHQTKIFSIFFLTLLSICLISIALLWFLYPAFSALQTEKKILQQQGQYVVSLLLPDNGERRLWQATFIELPDAKKNLGQLLERGEKQPSSKLIEEIDRTVEQLFLFYRSNSALPSLWKETLFWQESILEFSDPQNMVTTTDQLQKKLQIQVEDLLTLQLKTLKKIGLLCLGLFILGLLAALVFYLDKSIWSPMKTLQSAMKKLKSASFPIRMATSSSKNELTAVAEAFNQLSLFLENFYQTLEQDQQQVNQAFTAVSGISSILHDQLRQQFFATKELGVAVKNSQKILKNLDEKLSNLERIALSIKMFAVRGSDSIQQTHIIMQNMLKASSDIVATLATLRDKESKIAQAIQGIVKVADQSNLLSINSSIRAGKSGDQGKGFRVIAERIKEMADHIALATLELEKSIQDIITIVIKASANASNFMEQLGDQEKKIAFISMPITNLIGHTEEELQQLKKMKIEMGEQMQQILILNKLTNQLKIVYRT